MLMAVLFASCNKQTENLEAPKVLTKPTVEVPFVKVENGAMVFDNVEQMEKTIIKLIGMEESQLTAFYDRRGFMSLS